MNINKPYFKEMSLGQTHRRVHIDTQTGGQTPINTARQHCCHAGRNRCLETYVL